MIPDTFIQDLLERVDVADVVGRYVQLRKAGANLLGLCPFHNEKTPSFTVSPVKQFYHCFGCGAHGNAIRFLMEHTGASFPEAVRQLADAVGMQVPQVDSRRATEARLERERRQEQVSRHSEVLEAANAAYRRNLRSAHEAIAYLKQRGLSGRIAARYGLGWAKPDRHGLAHVFANYNDPDFAAFLVEVGLLIETEDGRRYDRFRSRVTFPIRNARGHLIGFGGRLIGPGEPKYLNSPETPVFSKGQELYGLWEAREAIRREGEVVVVEGYMDVVALAQMGVENVVATLGTSTTTQHVQKLLRVAHNVVFSFDGDQAGRRAAWRALQASLPVMRDDVSIRFLFLPPEHDPDSYVRTYGGDAFRQALLEAATLSSFMFEHWELEFDLNQPEGRAQCIRAAGPVLQAMPAGVLRLQITRDLAERVKLTPDELAQLIRLEEKPSGPLVQSEGRRPARQATVASEGGLRHKRRNPTAEGQADPAGWANHRNLRRTPVIGLSTRLLRLLLAHPQLVQNVDAVHLERIAQLPGFESVLALSDLVRNSGAQHTGAILQAATGTPLEKTLTEEAAHTLLVEELPEPATELRDALRTLSLRALRAEQKRLAAEAAQNPDVLARYAEVGREIAQLTSGGAGGPVPH